MTFDIHDLRLAARAVREAAAVELLPRFRRVTAHQKPDGSLLTEADLAMQSGLALELQGLWPEVRMLAEEMAATDQLALLRDDAPLWLLDPLDGTSNFAAGIGYFSVSLALLHAGRVQAAIVYDPVADECFSALRGQGVWLNDMPLMRPPAPLRMDDCMAMVDLKRLPSTLIVALAQAQPYRSQRSFGSVALDWCWLAAGRCQLYLHGGQRLWDYAAGQLIARESGVAGGVLARYDGRFLNRLDLHPYIGVAAANARLLKVWRGWIGQAIAQPN